jgi:ankyrin repeat protein
MTYSEKIIGEIEVHSLEGIRECFENGVSPNDTYRGLPLLDELTSEYLRTDRFKECVKLFLEYGLDFEDKLLLSVLSDDASSLEMQLSKDPALVNKRYTLRSAFTPLYEATLLHICAEFNHMSAAAVLVQYGADVNAKAGIDEVGFGGQTPVFHTVNQIHNHSIGMLHFLLERSANLTDNVVGIVWGKTYEWETLIPSVNAISYTLMGLLPQMHRSEMVIHYNLSLLLKYAYGIDYVPMNVPNKYLYK